MINEPLLNSACLCVCVYIYIYIYIYIHTQTYRQTRTHFVFFVSSYYLICYEVHSYLQYIFRLISTFMQLCSSDVCQLNIFYVSHLNIFTLF